KAGFLACFLPSSASQLDFPLADGLRRQTRVYVSSNTYPRTAKIWSIGESYGFRSTDVVRVYPERFSPNATIRRKCHGCPLVPPGAPTPHDESTWKPPTFCRIVLAMNAVRHYSETIPLGKTFHIGHGVSFQTTTYCM